MSDSELYLASPQAVIDVAAQLKRHEADADRPEERWTIANGVIGDRRNPWMMAFCMGEERRPARTLPGEPVVVYPTRQAVTVYFRTKDDRYIVTDMGEAVRMLRLRTGCRPHVAQDEAKAQVLSLRAHGQDWEMALCCGAIEIPHGVPAADLPRAICAVMLAAYRVGRLEVRG